MQYLNLVNEFQSVTLDLGLQDKDENSTASVLLLNILNLASLLSLST